jgi:hypothetical protein
MTTRRLGAMTAAVLAAGLAFSLTSAAVTSRSARASVPAASFGRAFALRLPGNSASVAAAYAFAVSCSSFGNCVVGGTYADKSGNNHPLAVSENSGKWSRGVELKLPKDAPASLYARIMGVSCTRTGDCTAVGDYQKPFAVAGRIFAVTETSGTWKQATELKLPSNAAWPPKAHLYAISCWAVGSCAATGVYYDSAKKGHAALFTESTGSWHRGIELVPSSDAGPTPYLAFNAIACQKGGQCVIAGSYVNAAGKWVGDGRIISHGTYVAAENIYLPPNADGLWLDISAVSCPSSTKCVIVGAYTDTSGQIQPLSAVESNDVFKAATEITTVPPGELHASLYAISCKTGGPCVAVGTYADTAKSYHAVAFTRSATGHWGYGTIVVNPPDGMTGMTDADLLEGVSCVTRGCVAAGTYVTKAGGHKPMAAIEP